MPDASTGPPAVGSPMMPLPPEASATGTGVVVFSQPARPAPANSAPAPASRPRRERPEGSFNPPASLLASTTVSSPREHLERPFKPTVLQDPLGGIVPGGRDHPSPGVSTRAAQVEPVHRRRVARQQRRRPHERHLVEPLLALEDRAADQPEDALQVRWRKHLVVHD